MRHTISTEARTYNPFLVKDKTNAPSMIGYGAIIQEI